MDYPKHPPPRRRQLRDAADRTSDRFLTRAEVEQRTGLSRSTIYHLMTIGQFPRPYRVGPRAVRWSQREVDEWVASRPRSYGARRRGELVNGDAQDTARQPPGDASGADGPEESQQ